MKTTRRNELTDGQQKVLCLIRSRGGEVALSDLTTYQGRSIQGLEREGYVTLVICGECFNCKLNAERHTDYICERVRIRAFNSK